MQELGSQNAWVSETIFWCLFIPFILWSFSPFVTQRKRFYTAVTYARLLMVLVGALQSGWGSRQGLFTWHHVCSGGQRRHMRAC